MKTNNNQLRTALFAVTILVLLTSGLAHADNIYVSCYGSGTVEKINWEGNRTTFASGLSGPTGLAFDSSGNLYAGAANSTIEKIDSSGNRSTFATIDQLSITGLAYDGRVNLYASCFGSHTIDKVDRGGATVIATDWFSSLSGPEGLAFDNGGYLYVANYTSGDIIKLISNGRGSFFASAGYGIVGLAFDRSNNLYVANYYDGTIAKFDLSGNGTIFASGLSAPHGLAFDSKGYLYVANSGNGTIEKFDSTGHGAIIATGLNQPLWVATQVPEPATLLLLGLGAAILRKKARRLIQNNWKR